MASDRVPDIRRIRLEERDYDIFEHVFMHRMLNLPQLDALVGSGRPYSEKYLSARCKLLIDAGFLMHPEIEHLVTNRRLYALGRRGAQELMAERTHLPVSPRYWEKPVGNVYIKHLTGVNDFVICLRKACERSGVTLSWAGHADQEQKKLVFPKLDGKERSAIQPDTSPLTIIRQNGEWAMHYLEFDRNSRRKGQKWSRRKYARYHAWWKETIRISSEENENFRVLIVCPDEPHMSFVRRALRNVGRTAEYDAWPFFLLTHAGLYSLAEADRVLDPIFYRADQDRPMSLLDD